MQHVWYLSVKLELLKIESSDNAVSEFQLVERGI